MTEFAWSPVSAEVADENGLKGVAKQIAWRCDAGGLWEAGTFPLGAPDPRDFTPIGDVDGPTVRAWLGDAAGAVEARLTERLAIEGARPALETVPLQES